ncbi:MAG: hypothetical protein ABI234_07725 [Ktedonobacteraceae bacterium]
MKSLVAYCPEAFVALMLRQAEIQARLKVTGGLISALQKQEFDISEIVVTDDLTAELQADYLDLEKLLVGIKVTGRLATEFQGYDLDADGLLEVVTDDGDEILLHFEFQSVNDKTIPERLLEYSFRAKKEHKKLVYSCVIFLRQDGIVPEPPLCWSLRNGKKILVFEYICIKLWEWTPEDLLALNQPALLPLLPLTKGGANRIIAVRVFEGLIAHGLQELVPIAQSLTSMVFGERDKQWQERLFVKMKKNILKDTWGYQFMVKDVRKEALEQGLEQGLERGLEKGREDGLRWAVLSMIAGRFPTVARLAEKQLTLIKHVTPLEKLLTKINTAQTATEVKQHLIEALDESIQLE